MRRLGVVESVEVSRRRDTLTFAHHQEDAPRFLVYADTTSKHGGFPRMSTLGDSNVAGCRTLRRAVAYSCGLLLEGGIKRGIKHVARVGCSGRSAPSSVCYSKPKNRRHQLLSRRCTTVSRSPRSVEACVPSAVSETVSGPCGSSRGLAISGTRWASV